MFKLEPCVPKTFGYSPWIQTNLKLYLSNLMAEILHFGNFIFEFLLMAGDFLEFFMDQRRQKMMRRRRLGGKQRMHRLFLGFLTQLNLILHLVFSLLILLLIYGIISKEFILK